MLLKNFENIGLSKEEMACYYQLNGIYASTKGEKEKEVMTEMMKEHQKIIDAMSKLNELAKKGEGLL